jgi:hypothetical protein
MTLPPIDYHIAAGPRGWGIYRDGMQIARRRDPADAIAFANFFADRETRLTTREVRVSADQSLHRTLDAIRLAA